MFWQLGFCPGALAQDGLKPNHIDHSYTDCLVFGCAEHWTTVSAAHKLSLHSDGLRRYRSWVATDQGFRSWYQALTSGGNVLRTNILATQGKTFTEWTPRRVCIPLWLFVSWYLCLGVLRGGYPCISSEFYASRLHDPCPSSYLGFVSCISQHTSALRGNNKGETSNTTCCAPAWSAVDDGFETKSLHAENCADRIFLSSLRFQE